MQANYHPSDTSRIVRFNQIDNFALRYRHFLKIDKPREHDWTSKYKINFQRSAHRLETSSLELVNRLRDRQTHQLQQFAAQGLCLYCVDATVDWRLIVGLGSDHIQETNMALHHIYGIPYIPGSAVKGVLRHWWLQENEDFLDSNGKIDEGKALENSDFLSVFGSQKQRGEVQFLDAYPEEVTFATDIMNPHYPDYYSGSKPPTDHQNPVPINFLTVEQTCFRFTFLAKTEAPLDELKKRFQDALELKGVGAKTAVGYGYFRDFTDRTADILDKLRQQQQAEQEEAERQREATRLASLSPVEKLAEELNRLADSQTNEARATQIYNEQLQSLEGNEKQMIAQALKSYWQRINKWERGSKKQRIKVMAVKSILGEN